MIMIPLFDFAKDAIDVNKLVFALKRGSLPWPGIMLRRWTSRSCIVQFVLTDEVRSIYNNKIWPYNTRSKQAFINVESLESDEFCKAVVMVERALPEPQPITPADANNHHELMILDQMQWHCASLSMEPKFIRQVNALSSSIAMQNYAAAQLAFKRLLRMQTISQLLLVRNPKAIYAIRKLVGYVSYRNATVNNQKMIRNLARRLVRRFSEVFNALGITDFWFLYEMRAYIYATYAKATESVK